MGSKVKGVDMDKMFVQFDEIRLNDEEAYKEVQKIRKEEK